VNFVSAASAAVVVCLSVGTAHAGEKPLVGPAPAWVHQAPEPNAASLPKSGAVFPLFDEQVLVEGDTVTGYFDTATLITSPEVLNRAGTIAFPWQPDHGDVTFHRIEILRNGEHIDALKNGAGLTVLRREAGLEQKMLDGRLTAVQHVEGLQVGDILRMTLSISQRDALLQGNVQDGMVLIPAPVEIGFGRARLIWPEGRNITWKALMPGVTATTQPIEGNRREAVFTLPVPKLPEMPKNYPARFQPVSLIVFSSFSDWAAVKTVMAPLYRTKGALPADLVQRIDAIAAKSTDPQQRMADALQLVQDDVRYQLVALGTGNYAPQTPADTWVKRYGDCKAKTMLLLAILDRLGIQAEPVLANSKRGDAVREMPPSAIAFDHVFVRAEVAGVSYWLDGTMLGSRIDDIHDAPGYGTVLPLFARDGGLVDLPRRAHARPDLDIAIDYDMSAGPHFPAPFTLKLSYAGFFGASKRIEGGGDVEDRLKTFAEKAAKQWLDSDDIGKPKASFDPVKAVWTVQVDGVAYPNWQFEDGRNQLELLPTVTVAFDASRGRSAWREIPALIQEPWTAHSHLTIRLPDAGKDATLTGGGSAISLPVVDWRRQTSLSNGEVVQDVMSRESGAEVAPDQISATQKTIRDAVGKAAHIDLPVGYPERWDDVARMRRAAATLKVRTIYDQRIAAKPEDMTRLADRAWFEGRFLDYAAAEADYTRAIALDRSSKRYLDRSQVRSKRGDHAGALADAQAAYDLEQGNAEVRSQLANELTYAGQVDKALDLLNADPDVATDDGLSDFLDRLGIDELGGRFDDATELADAALKKHPRMAKLLNARCWLRGLHNAELEGALIDCNKAIELSADPASFLDSRGMVHFRAGQMPAALADYNAALDASPEFPSALFMSGIVLTRMGQGEKGAARLRAARMLNPNMDQYYARFGVIAPDRGGR
jgi:tetratricopeptide (TPR) repeat protein